MLRIITHIERLLLVHDCVIVPKFGGFVLQTVSAVCNGEEHLFSPQRKEIVFNITLQHNDGLLSESYMQMYGVNYRKAQLMLEEDVDDMKAALQEEKRLSFGLLGSFSLGQEGQMIFHPGESDAFSVCSYGLAAFNFPQLKPVYHQIGKATKIMSYCSMFSTFSATSGRKLLFFISTLLRLLLSLYSYWFQLRWKM